MFLGSKTKHLYAAYREPETRVQGSGHLLVDLEPEASFGLLESSCKGELSGGKSLESSAECFIPVLVNHLWDEPSMSLNLTAPELPDSADAFLTAE